MFSVGDRVSLDDGSTGTLRFLGPTQFRQGVWAGIELDNSTGKHDGTVEGVEYFRTEPNKAVFVHPSKLASEGRSARLRKNSAPTHGEWSSKTPLTEEWSGRAPPITTEQVKTPVQTTITKSLPMITTKQSYSAATAHVQTPPTMAKLDVELLREKNSSAISNVNDTDKYSLANMELELEKRHAEMQHAKSGLNALRLQISDHQDISDYLLNRERLLAALDHYEKSLGRYDRQAKRVNFLQLKAEREKTASSNPKEAAAMKESQRFLEQDKEALLNERLELAQRLEEAKNKVFGAEETLRLVQEQLQAKDEIEDNLKAQIRENASNVANLNRDRSVLRKEIADLRAKFSELVSSDTSPQLRELTAELNTVKQKYEALVGENKTLTGARNEILAQEADDLEKLNSETVAVCRKYEERIKEKEEEIRLLHKENAKISELLQEVDFLKKEKELGNAQVSNLQSKLIDYQDAAQLEVKHRAQIEALRTSLEENYIKFTAEAAEKDARIEELQRQVASISRPHSNKEAVLSIVSSADANSQVSLERIASQLVEEQHKFAELYKAKETQEKYLMHQIAKYKRRYANQAQFVVGKSETPLSSEREDDFDLKVSELQAEIDSLKRDRDELEKKKDTELYAIQLRLSATELERDKAKAKIEEFSGPLVRNQSEVDILKKEIDDLVRERDILRSALHDDSGKFRNATTELDGANHRIDTLTELLNTRTDELARLEASHRETLKSVRSQEVVIENLKREYGSKSRVSETNAEILQKKIEDLQHELQVKYSEDKPLEKIIKERNDYAQALEQSRLECERLQKAAQNADSREVEILRMKIQELQTSQRGSTEGLMVIDTDGQKPTAAVSRLEEDLKTAREMLQDKESLITKLTKQKDSLEKLQETYLRDGSLSQHDISKLDSLYDELRHLRVQNEKLEQALATAQERCRELETTPSVSGGNADSHALQRTLDEEIKKRKELESHNTHKKEMLDLAEKELLDLQQRIADLENTDESRKRLAVKFNALKEDLQLAGERLSVKEEEIQQLRTRLEEIVQPGKEGSESDVVKRLQAENDQVTAEKVHLKRMNVSLEHEKALLEAELITIREALKTLKTEVGIKQQHALLTKAGHLIDELHQTHQESSWRILNPIKSVASFMRIYKPADVDVEKLHEEYEELLASLEAHGAGRTPGLVLDGNVCSICKQTGHAADQCGSGSSRDPGIAINDPNPFSA
ncbi:CAP-Gly domain protein [Paramicrosporidium saccamoebae]|uniref:CAP-Gly domain protein n=1 Tax=Paramicrosporidium saccamoebae TaxID=1246581 RepID=A0A2H9THL8_9FUNG|nr:CAP-Gly domain protein [Paramicrosporidium saccamoebae]